MKYNLTAPSEIQAILAKHELRPNHAFGQNFLVDRHMLDAIVEAAGLSAGDRVLEVGPGLGTLTQELMERSGDVVAVEKDEGLYRILRERWQEDPRLKLQLGDALELDYATMFAPENRRFLVSNLPYSVGTRIVMEAALQETPPERMVILVQKEVGERFVAPPRSPDRGTASVWLQQLYDVEIVRLVKPTCFWPKPEVTSAIVRLQRQERFPLTFAQRQRMVALSRIAFQHRRKQMATLFRNAPAGIQASPETLRAQLEAMGLPATARAEELSIEQWCHLAQGFEK